MSNSTAVGDWTPNVKREPVVRIGIVLEEDARDSLQITLPDAPTYRLGGREALPAGAGLRVRRANGAVTTQAAGERYRLTVLRIEPSTPCPLERNAGVLVQGVVAGRGFHWQKEIDVHLPGVLELRDAPGGLLLINELPLEAYLAGVAVAEMGAACPHDLLAAQIVAGRAWLLAMTEAKHPGAPFDRCADDCCQRYQGTDELNEATTRAINETRGEVLFASDGRVLDANYSKSCGGISELPGVVWGFVKPGLSAVVDAPPGAPEHRFLPVTEASLDEYLSGAWVSGAQAYCSPNAAPLDAIGQYLGRVDEVDDYFRWRVHYTRGELEAVLREKSPTLAALDTLVRLRVTGRGVSGRASQLEVVWRGADGAEHKTLIRREYDIRNLLHRKFLYSSAIAIDEQTDAGGALAEVTIRGAGWGHGAGLCQIGALGMALAGKGWREICAHYYPEAALKKSYD